jgi:beta-galactosidase
MRDESKGITKSVTLAGEPLTHWQIYPLPMQQLPTEQRFEDSLRSLNPNLCGASASFSHWDFMHGCVATGPTFYRGSFILTSTADTFLDIRHLGKGALWINGHAIGRFWNIGPQQTLFVPGPWLREGTNEIVVFDLAPTANTPTVAGLPTPILDGPVIDTSLKGKRSNPQP